MIAFVFVRPPQNPRTSYGLAMSVKAGPVNGQGDLEVSSNRSEPQGDTELKDAFEVVADEIEGGHPAEAIAPLRHAISLAPNPALMQAMLGQALIASNKPQFADEAITTLRAALARDSDIADAYAQLAMAYGRKGDLAQADLASAQSAFSRGDMRTARQLAVRAKGRFPIGSPGWVKADDIASVKLPATPMRQ